MASPKRTLGDWRKRGDRRLSRLIKEARKLPALARLGPKRPWKIGLEIVRAPAMKRLNFAYRKKRYATDVLSFGAPEVFREAGYLGELVVCVPVLLAQARELGHGSDIELEVLLVHGLLHLLGFDHELGKEQAALMGRWESRLLEKSLKKRMKAGERLPSLIERARSCKTKRIL